MAFDVRFKKGCGLAIRPAHCIFVLASALGFSGCAGALDRNADLIGLSKTQLVQRFGYPASVSMITGATQGAPGYEEWIYYEQSPLGKLAPVGIIFTNTEASLGRVVTYPSGMQPNRIVKMDSWTSFKAIFEAEAKSRNRSASQR